MWQALGLRPEQCCELVDFYHVVEHLYKLAGLKRKSTTRKRRQWVKRWRRGLLKGKPKQVLEEIKKCTSGRIGKELRRERNFFLRNARAGRMNYAAPPDSAFSRAFLSAIIGAGMPSLSCSTQRYYVDRDSPS